jgi:hypothetical protein
MRLRDPELERWAQMAAHLGLRMDTATGLLSPNSRQLNTAKAAKADANGNATFTFEAPPNGTTQTGTISVPTAPTTATFQVVIGANVGGQPWGDWGGNSIYGPIQASGNQVVVVTATGLTPNTAYLCSWIGSADPTDLVQPIYPSANVSALVALTQPAQPVTLVPAAQFTASGGNVTMQVTLPSYVRTLLIFIQSNPGALTCTGVSVVGATTSMTYYNQPPYLPGNIGTAPSYLVVVPVAPSIDPVVTIGYTFTTGAWQGTIEVSGDTSIYDESVYYNGTVHLAQTTAVGTTLLINGPVRLLTAQCTTAAGNISSARLEVNASIMLTADSTAVSTQQTQAHASWGEGIIVKAGQSLNGVIVNNGIVLITYAYP